MTEGVRDPEQRVADALEHLERDHDLWIATGGEDGEPWLVPLSFHWTGEAVLLATPAANRTVRNLAAGGGARIALGPTRDVVMVDGEVDLPTSLPHDDAEAVARATGVDPRDDDQAAYVRIVPRRVQAWRNVAEIAERTIMRDGRWLAPP